MKIDNIQSINMTRTNPLHFGTGKIKPLVDRSYANEPSVPRVEGLNSEFSAASFQRSSKTGKSFENYLIDALNTVNDNQMQVDKLQEKLITDPDSIDIHDVTIAVSKARMSMNLAQTVIDRLVTSWNEISTTR